MVIISLQTFPNGCSNARFNIFGMMHQFNRIIHTHSFIHIMLILSHLDRIDPCTITACARRFFWISLPHFSLCISRLLATLSFCEILACSWIEKNQNGNKTETNPMKRYNAASMSLVFFVIFAVIDWHRIDPRTKQHHRSDKNENDKLFALCLSRIHSVLLLSCCLSFSRSLPLTSHFGRSFCALYRY